MFQRCRAVKNRCVFSARVKVFCDALKNLILLTSNLLQQFTYSISLITTVTNWLLLLSHVIQSVVCFQTRGRHGNGNSGNNHRDGDKSREESGNTKVIGFRIIGNTAGIKLINTTDVVTGEALPNKTAGSSSTVIDREPTPEKLSRH